MNLLLDTHIVIWALTDDPRLSEKARRLIMTPSNVIHYSTASLWEVAIKHAIHPDRVEFTARDLAEYCRQAGYLPLPITDEHVFAVETLTRPADAPRHNDPFDRILLAQAKAEGMQFLTHDSLIPYYGEDCIVSV